jgi:uncharacterized iron-regulated membrane protein
MGKKWKLFRNWDRHQKSWYGKWHLYLGIIAGGIIAIIALTGSILVFRDEIDKALNPKLFEVLSSQKRLSPDAVYQVFHNAHPKIFVNYIYQPNDIPTSTYIFYDYGAQKQYFVNPFNGNICGKRLYDSGFINVVMRIHTSLLVESYGQYITGIASLILLILTISGLRLWIPKQWKNLKSVLTVKKGAHWKRQNYDWHNILGFYSAPIVTILSLTGFCITFYLPIVGLAFLLSGKSPNVASEIYSKQSTYIKGKTPLTIDQVLQKSTIVFPQSKATGIALPSDSLGSYRLDFKSPGGNKEGNREMAVVDQYSGKILITSRQFPNIGNAILSWLMPLHYGTFGGLPTRILALLGGLIPMALFITGFIIWHPRWKKQKHKADPPKQKQIENLRNGAYFKRNCRLGTRYALWTILIAGICGILYGVFSGIVFRPALFAILFIGFLAMINFIFAFGALLFDLIILAPFKRFYQPVLRYFAISLMYFLIFGILYNLLMNTGMRLF